MAISSDTSAFSNEETRDLHRGDRGDGNGDRNRYRPHDATFNYTAYLEEKCSSIVCEEITDDELASCANYTNPFNGDGGYHHHHFWGNYTHNDTSEDNDSTRALWEDEELDANSDVHHFHHEEEADMRNLYEFLEGFDLTRKGEVQDSGKDPKKRELRGSSGNANARELKRRPFGAEKWGGGSYHGGEGFSQFNSSHHEAIKMKRLICNCCII